MLADHSPKRADTQQVTVTLEPVALTEPVAGKPVMVSGPAYPGETFAAKADFMDKVVDGTTRTV